MMQKRYSDWIGAEVYDMTKEQEQHLIDNGFEIGKYVSKEHDDGIARDIPNYIEADDKYANLKFDRRKGNFYIQLQKEFVMDANAIEYIKRRLDELAKIINELHDIGGIK